MVSGSCSVLVSVPAHGRLIQLGDSGGLKPAPASKPPIINPHIINLDGLGEGLITPFGSNTPRDVHLRLGYEVCPLIIHTLELHYHYLDA